MKTKSGRPPREGKNYERRRSISLLTADWKILERRSRREKKTMAEILRGIIRGYYFPIMGGGITNKKGAVK